MKHIGTQRIETESIVLRRFREDDAEALYKNWASDPEVVKFLTWPVHDSAETSGNIIKSWIAGYDNMEQYQWAVILKENGDEPIGSIGAVRLDDDTRMAHIGYCIGRRWWNQGVMSRALQAVIDYMFSQGDFNRIESRHDPRNPNSGKVMKHCRMQYEGTMRQADVNNQGIADCSFYAVLRTDWEDDRELV